MSLGAIRPEPAAMRLTVVDIGHAPSPKSYLSPSSSTEHRAPKVLQLASTLLIDIEASYNGRKNLNRIRDMTLGHDLAGRCGEQR